MATIQQIKAALTRARKTGVRCVRVLSTDHPDYGKLRPGDTNMTPSSVWEDGFWTPKNSLGVSCIRSDFKRLKTSYPGDEIVFLDAHRGGYEEGEDEGEIVLSHPLVVDVYRLRNKKINKKNTLRHGHG